MNSNNEKENDKQAVPTQKPAEKTEVKAELKKSNKVKLSQRIGKMLREYKSELGKIVWYNREQTFKSSVIVIISIVAVSAFISALDFGFSSALMWLGSLI